MVGPRRLVERPGIVPGAPEIWVYADRFSYFGGDTVSIRVHTTAEEYDLEIVRDGARPQQVAQYVGLPGKQQQTPADAYAVGCDWSESLAVEIDPKWTSGMYLVLVRMLHEGVTIEREGFFVVKAREPEHADFVLIHTTSTMLAYNDWGGANHYRGVRTAPAMCRHRFPRRSVPSRGGCCANPRAQHATSTPTHRESDGYPVTRRTNGRG